MNATMKAAIARLKYRTDPSAANFRASRLAGDLAEVERRLLPPAAEAKAKTAQKRSGHHVVRPLTRVTAMQIGPQMLMALQGRVIGHAMFSKGMDLGDAR